MTGRIELDKKLNEVLDRLDYVHMIIRNLKERNGTALNTVASTNKRLFNEISNYVILTDQLKLDFIQLIVEDAKRCRTECEKNINQCEPADGQIRELMTLLEDIEEHEAEDIEYSEKAQAAAEQAKEELEKLRSELDTSHRSRLKEKAKYTRQDTTYRWS